MARSDHATFEGTVTEHLPNLKYRVTLENGHKLTAHLAGRLRRVRVYAGDRVTVAVSPYDLSRGIIRQRHK